MSYAEDRQPRGWLRFLIIVLMVLTPLVGFGRMYGETADTEQLYPQLVGMTEWEQYKTASWLLFGLQSVWAVAAGYRLNTVFQPSSPRFAISFFWLGSVGLTFLFFLIAGSFFNIDFFAGAAASETVGPIFGAAFWATVWSLYLVRSKQVRELYYGASEIDVGSDA